MKKKKQSFVLVGMAISAILVGIFFRPSSASAGRCVLDQGFTKQVSDVGSKEICQNFCALDYNPELPQTCLYDGEEITVTFVAPSIVHWTCVRKFEKFFSDAIKDEGIEASQDFSCLEFDKSSYKNDERAQSACYDSCELYNRAKPPNPCVQAYFIPTLSCAEYRGGNFGGLGQNPFTIDVVRSQAGNLNRAGLSLAGFVGRVIRVAIGVLGTIALVMFIHAGLMWMTSRGNATVAEASRNEMMWAALGVVVILSSYVVVNWLFGAFS